MKQGLRIDSAFVMRASGDPLGPLGSFNTHHKRIVKPTAPKPLETLKQRVYVICVFLIREIHESQSSTFTQFESEQTMSKSAPLQLQIRFENVTLLGLALEIKKWPCRHNSIKTATFHSRTVRGDSSPNPRGLALVPWGQVSLARVHGGRSGR